MNELTSTIRRWTGLSGLLATLVSCGPSSGNSDIFHASRPHPEPSDAWRFIAESPEDFRAFLARTPMSGATLLHEEGEFGDFPRFANDWLLRLDEAWRARVGEGASAVPVPRVEVLVGPVNGVAHARGVCLRIPARVESGVSPEKTSSGDDAPGFLAWSEASQRLVVSRLKVKSESCTRVTADSNEAKAFLSHLSRVNEACRVGVESEGGLAFSEGCVDGQVPGARYEGVTWNAVGNRVALFSGAWQQDSEDAFVFVLAHELAHYYFAHPLNASAESENRFYDLRRGYSPAEVIDPSLESLGARARAASRRWEKTYEPAHEPTRWSMVLAHPEMSELAKALSKEESCPGESQDCPCRDAERRVSAPEGHRILVDKISRIRRVGLDEATLAFFRGLETALVSCAKDHRLGEKTQRLLSLRRFSLGSGREPQMPETLATVADALDWASTMVRDWQREDHGILEEAAQRHLGWYTDEQEADEFALEWVASIGLRPSRVVDLAFSMLSQRRWTYPPQVLRYRECLQQREVGWTSAIVPVGEFRDSHHSDCFRAWNLEQEILRHGYREREVEASPEWLKLSARAHELWPEFAPVGEEP